jgi:uncharacterized protein YuzE
MAGVVVVGDRTFVAMKERYLEVTFRRGKPVGAYLYLPRISGETSVRTERREQGLLVDYAADGRAIGIEITAPNQVTLAAINQALAALAEEPATSEELAPVAGA